MSKWPTSRPKGMDKLSWAKLRSCGRKVRYRSKGKARRRAYPHGLVVYRCLFCHGYHAGKRQKAKHEDKR